jgi:hypothetical protein
VERMVEVKHKRSTDSAGDSVIMTQLLLLL